MITRSDPVRNRFDTIQTISSVITAVCLLVLTISLLVAGSYTVTTVNKLQSTYHPEKLASIISDASDTMTTIHKTTSMLKSSTLWSTVNFAPYRVTVFFNFSKKPISLFGIC